MKGHLAAMGETRFNRQSKAHYNFTSTLGILLTNRTVLLIGILLGLATSGAVLTLLWFGVAGILYVNGAHLRHLFWPSSVMLVVGWRSTIPGVMITISAVAINCLLYTAIAYGFARILRLVRTLPVKPE